MNSKRPKNAVNRIDPPRAEHRSFSKRDRKSIVSYSRILKYVVLLLSLLRGVALRLPFAFRRVWIFAARFLQAQMVVFHRLWNYQ
jgi:hypothetical protein